MPRTIFLDPSLVGPDMRFSTGVVASGVEQFQAALPAIGGLSDPGWNITQWNTPSDQLFNATTPIRGNRADTDPLLGRAQASWHTGTASSGSELVVYGEIGDYTYRLGATGGATRDTFLQTTGYASGADTFDHPITFTASERIAAAAAGSGTAIAFNSFTVFFNAAGNPVHDQSLPTLELFLQVPLTDFRGQPAPYSTIARGQVNQQIFNLSSQTTQLFGGPNSDASSNYLAFAADPGPLHTVRIDLNQALLRMVDAMAAQDPGMASAYLDLSRWSVGSFYAGVETDGAGNPNGNRDGTGPGSLVLDIAHPTLTEDPSRSLDATIALSTVQSIDNNRYANLDDSPVITTRPGTTNTITLAPGLDARTITSFGTDTISVGDLQTARLQALGGRLTAIGHTRSFATITIGGSAPITTSGALGTLTITGSGNDDEIGGSVSGTATLSLSGQRDGVNLAGTVNAQLFGAGATLAAGAGTVWLHAGGSRIDLAGTGAQIVQLDGEDATVTETGTGSQTIIGAASQAGHVSLSGGHGTQTLWTGGTTATVTAAAADTSQRAALTIHAQFGSSTTIQLGGERTTIDDEGGQVTAQGSSQPGLVTLEGGSGRMTLWGGAEQLIASDGNLAATGNALQIRAGSGSQTIFGGREALTVLGSHDTAGTQTVVNGTDSLDATTILGGRTLQTIWTGQAHDTIIASTSAGDSSGRIEAFIQGGASSYQGGVETAALNNQGGILDAFLAGSGQVSILADMAHSVATSLSGFRSGPDTLTLSGVPDPSRVAVSHAGGSTILSVSGDPGHVTLAGIASVTLSHTPAGVLVTV